MRALYLSKDLELIKKQLYGGLELKMRDLKTEDLLDDMNTDIITPAWVCFDYKPEDIAVNAYAGLADKDNNNIFKERALLDSQFDTIISGYRKGTRSSREQAAQCEKFCGIKLVIAASFAPIYQKHNINLGQLMGNHEQLIKLESGDFVLATDSHTCMAGGSDALGYGIGVTEYAALLYVGKALLKVPESVRFDLMGELDKSCTAKDLMLYISEKYVKNNTDQITLDRVIEFGGSSLECFSPDEKATLCNMATECLAKSGICEVDLKPNQDAFYHGGRFEIDLKNINPRVAKPGDPTQGCLISNLDEVKIDVAYGGSCTAGKIDDFKYYARVVEYYLSRNKKISENLKFYIQYGSLSVQDWALSQNLDKLFKSAGIELNNPGCGACIGCGPGVSEYKEQVTVSAINRNFSGRSGPGKLYLVSPLTVAASAFEGKIVAYDPL